MFFAKLFLATGLTICLNGFAFGQEVCGWVPVTEDNAPQILKDEMIDRHFVDSGSVEISTDHSLWGEDNNHSLKFTDLGSAEKAGVKLFMKEFIISIGDTFSIFADIKGFSNKQIAGSFYLISGGELYRAGFSNLFLTTWTQSAYFHRFFKLHGSGTPANLDTLIIAIKWYEEESDPVFPFGALWDNLTYEKYSTGEKIVFDKMGDGEAVEEPKKKMNNSMLVKISPNPFFSRCRIFAPENTTEMEIFDLSGRKVKTLRGPVWDGKTDDGNEVQAGFYFIKAGKYKPVKVVKLR